ncbi:MAG TPA: TRAP transporter small permease subunit [Ramlibacter sp.]|jgi:TRAP-type C4-dicarboxylate transport system permease small subunit
MTGQTMDLPPAVAEPSRPAAPRGALAQRAIRVNGVICAGEEAIAVALFYAMLAGFIVQVFARFVIRYPLPWSEELCRHFFTWMGALGTSIGIRWGAHFVAFDLQSKLAGWPKRIVVAVVNLSVGTIAVVLLVEGVGFTRDGLEQMTPILNIPTAIPDAAIPVSAALVLWHLAYGWVFGRSGAGMDFLGLDGSEA